MRLLMKLAAAASITAPLAITAAPSSIEGVRVPAHERIVLDNGVTLLIVPRRDIPLIAFDAVLRGGALEDPAGKSGVAALVAGLMEKGAGARSAFEFADAVEGAGGSFNAVADVEAIAVSGQFLARDQQLMIDLLADALLRPRFEPMEFTKLRARRIELLKAAKDAEPSQLVGTYGRAFLFDQHPYARPVVGSERSLAAIERQDVLDHYRTRFGADRLTLIFAGDVQAAELKQAVARFFGQWPRARIAAPAPPAPARKSGRSVLLVDAPGSVQTYFWLGSVGVDKRYPQRAALDLVNTLYGGRFTSILNTELRIKSGLSYGARSGFTQRTVPGEFAIHTSAQTDRTAEALDVILATLERLHAERITPKMLDSARAYELGQYPLGFETAADWAAALGELELYGLPPEYIDDYGAQLQQVRPEHARQVIDSVFPRAADVAIVLIGDAAKIRSQLAKYGPVTVMPLTQPDFAPQPA